ncbi:hypothetical protein ACW9HQ_24750 [Nocardia gipuzkoensis]
MCGQQYQLDPQLRRHLAAVQLLGSRMQLLARELEIVKTCLSHADDGIHGDFATT